MSPKARQGLVILAASALVLGVLVGAGVALWRDLGVEERAVLEPVLNPRLGLLIMIGLVGAGAAAVLMRSFAQDSIEAPALLADEIGLLVGTDPSRRLKPPGSPELQRIAEAVNSLADQRQSLQDDVESRIREARLSVEEERNRLAALSIGIPLQHIWAIVWAVAGFVALVAGLLWGARLGVQFALTLVALKALPVLILGGFTSVPGAIVGGLIIGASEKLAEVYVGPFVGGGIENWFAYVLALGFLLVRPEGLFGERHIDRV